MISLLHLCLRAGCDPVVDLSADKGAAEENKYYKGSGSGKHVPKAAPHCTREGEVFTTESSSIDCCVGCAILVFGPTVLARVSPTPSKFDLVSHPVTVGRHA